MWFKCLYEASNVKFCLNSKHACDNQSNQHSSCAWKNFFSVISNILFTLEDNNLEEILSVRLSGLLPYCDQFSVKQLAEWNPSRFVAYSD